MLLDLASICRAAADLGVRPVLYFFLIKQARGFRPRRIGIGRAIRIKQYDMSRPQHAEEEKTLSHHQLKKASLIFRWHQMPVSKLYGCKTSKANKDKDQVSSWLTTLQVG
jgi:hypothetical protein